MVECTSNDPFFNRLCDLDSSLPSLTFPILEPVKLTVIGVFQVALWQEGLENAQNKGLDLSNKILLKYGQLFSKFFAH